MNYLYQQVKEQSVVLQMPDKTITEVPCGMVVWAAVSLSLLHSMVRLQAYFCRETREGKSHKIS